MGTCADVYQNGSESNVSNIKLLLITGHSIASVYQQDSQSLLLADQMHLIIQNLNVKIYVV